MFGINTQTQFIATPVAADVKARALNTLEEMRSVKFKSRENETVTDTKARVSEWMNHRNDNFNKKVVAALPTYTQDRLDYINEYNKQQANKVVQKTIEQLKAEKAAKDMLVAEVRIPVKKSFWQRLFA